LNDHCKTGEKEIVAKGFRNYNNNAVPIYRREDQLQEEQEENKNRLKNISKKNKQTDKQNLKRKEEKRLWLACIPTSYSFVCRSECVL